MNGRQHTKLQCALYAATTMSGWWTARQLRQATQAHLSRCCWRFETSLRVWVSPGVIQQALAYLKRAQLLEVRWRSGPRGCNLYRWKPLLNIGNLESARKRRDFLEDIVHHCGHGREARNHQADGE